MFNSPVIHYIRILTSDIQFFFGIVQLFGKYNLLFFSHLAGSHSAK
jgi:hypothetical protein